jgi:hypothetical protein
MALFLTLTVDWFEPTGSLLREGGAKPAILIISIIMMTQLFRSRFVAGFQGLSLLAASVPAMGLFAFIANILNGWSEPVNNRYPAAQFGFQSMLLILAVFAPFILSGFIRKGKESVLFMNYVLLAALIHFLVVVLEYCAPDTVYDLLLYFRGPDGLIDRPSGLMSEPSYFGAFAALFGLPLLLLKCKHGVWGKVLGASLIFFGMSIQAKTIVPVLLGQVAIIVVYSKNRQWLFTAMTVFLISVSYVLIFTNVLDTSLNMSSATRFGSAELGLDLLSKGYAITGIGTGQFHFFYTYEFAPDSLLVSPDFTVYLNEVAASRGSTYNFPIRLILETGIIGALCYLTLIYKILNRRKQAFDQATICNSNTSLGLLLIGGSFGFLMTQDPYCYPPLILGLALILAGRPHSDNTHVPSQISG